jgi:GAF domain-containing protein/HAMP domain-containing protein
MTTAAQPKRKRAGFFSVTTRLFVTMILAVVIPVFITQAAGTIVGRGRLTPGFEQNLHLLAEREAASVSKTLTSQVDLLTILAEDELLETAAVQSAEEYEGSGAEIQVTLLERDEAWQAADAADDNTDPLIQAALSHPASISLNEFRELYPYHAEVFLTDAYGAIIATTNRTSDYYQADEEWWQAAWNNGEGANYIADQVEFDESSQTYSINMATVIRDDTTGDPVGVLRSTYDIKALQESIGEITFGETGHAILVTSEGYVLAAPGQISPDLMLPDLVPLLAGSTPPTGRELDLTPDENGETAVVATSPVSTGGLYPAVDDLGWYIAVFQPESEMLAPISGWTTTALMITLIIAGAGSVAALFIARALTRPLGELTRVAEHLGASQDWSTRVAVRSKDEFGVLGEAFNEMASHLEGAIGTLEHRVADRTRDLQTVADVNAEISTVLDVERLMQDVVDLTKERFRLYHAHIYLVDDDAENLILTAGAGHVGRQMVSEGRSIYLHNQQSIVAQAARDQTSVIIDDVTQSEAFLPHPLLPDTRSELATPLIARGQLLGILDVQSDEMAYFSEETLDVMELLAGQIATALSNARLFEVVERTSRHEQAVGTITRRIQEAVDLDDILQVTVRELGKALRVPYTAIELKIADDNGGQSPDAQPEGVQQAADEA